MTTDERATVLNEIDIWGQRRAWTDELISCWVAELIRKEYGQSVVQLDCLL